MRYSKTDSGRVFKFTRVYFHQYGTTWSVPKKIALRIAKDALEGN